MRSMVHEGSPRRGYLPVKKRREVLGNLRKKTGLLPCCIKMIIYRMVKRRSFIINDPVSIKNNMMNYGYFTVALSQLKKITYISLSFRNSKQQMLFVRFIITIPDYNSYSINNVQKYHQSNT
jgi:hypothetical protein